MILVTGGAGYVGSHFLKLYLARSKQNQAVVIDNLSRGHKQSIALRDRLFLDACDIADSHAVEKVLKEFSITAVVHFAAYAYVAESQSDPFAYLRNNVVKSISLFESMEKCNVRKIVFSSSCATYGTPEYLPLDEEHRQKPTSVYGATKLIIEQALSSLTDSLGWSSVLLRYFNAAGASEDGEIGESHDPETHLIPNLLRAASGRLEAATICGTDYDTPDGTCIRDYVHVDDLALAHCQALELLQSTKEPTALAINLGTSTGASVLEVLSHCETVTKRPVPTIKGPRRSGDPPALVANSNKAEQILGWKPRHNLRSTIETAWRWEQNRRY